MKVVLVGYGKMGREIETAARARGHEVIAVVDPAATGPRTWRSLGRAALRGAAAAFEFTTPATAAVNVKALLAAGVPVVCGTTGWDPGTREFTAVVRKSTAGAVVAPNFSVGMNLFYRVVAEAARLYGATGFYDPFIEERHHRAKLDAPSGTALRLAKTVASADPRDGGMVHGEPDGRIPPGAVHVGSVRAGHEAGLHTVGFDGPHDVVTLAHHARGRSGFAAGAVLAAEWVVGRRGVHGFDEVLDDLLKRPATRGRGRRS